ALDGKEDGLYFYDRIIREAGAYLNENGIIIFEIGYDQAEDIRTLLVENAFFDVKIIKDYAGLNRIVCASRNQEPQ
ncbi:MAG: peptide chain release factor N(5)-glutamine methyltransferase, partial [Lachnospiraceae bacterium]|nr:peptide chain release factor N(5)-glutamine methyltransferase [Lachnospiraceae bacterium]